MEKGVVIYFSWLSIGSDLINIPGLTKALASDLVEASMPRAKLRNSRSLFRM
jgi:hypothetical protein